VTAEEILGGERHDLRLADYRNGFEVEAIDGLAGRQPGFGEMTRRASTSVLIQPRRCSFLRVVNWWVGGNNPSNLSTNDLITQD
jgi:hypothetical protein